MLFSGEAGTRESGRILRRVFISRKGEAMVEGAIAFPLMILTAMLMLRMFVFCFEVLNTGVSEHEAALEASYSYSGAGIRTYSREAEISLAAGGILKHTAVKKIRTRLYFVNEDLLVRAGEAIGH